MKRFHAGICAPVFAAAVAAVWCCPAGAATINVIDTISSHGYVFTNCDGADAGTIAGTGTTINGIANNGSVVGFTTQDGASFHNFIANPLASSNEVPLNINGAINAMATADNSAGTVVGADGNGNAFTLSGGTVSTFIPPGGTSAMALGINDAGTIVGQYTNAAALSPGFIRSGSTYITINAPAGPDVVNAQGVNLSGVVAGFYLGNDGNDHGFLANSSGASGNSVTGMAVADPAIPNVPGEPGATFVFSQLLGINDSGIVAGYYGDSTISQHGFLYDTHTRQYTFLDDPDAAFSNGVQMTQITGINNSGQLSGFYSDANGVLHGFIATPVPEPASLTVLGISGVVLLARRRR